VLTARHLELMLGIALILVYLVLRTLDFPPTARLGWGLVMAGVSLVWPTAGLVAFVAIVPFTEPFVLVPGIGAKPFLLFPVLAGYLLRAGVRGGHHLLRLQPRLSRAAILAWRPRSWLVSAALLAALALAATTAFSVWTSKRFGPEFLAQSAGFWLVGIGGGIAVLFAGYAAGRERRLAPLVVALLSASLAGVVSLVDFAAPELIRESALDWLLRTRYDSPRLMGVIPSPNGVAALVVIPCAAFLTGALLAPGWRWKLLLAVLAMPLVAILYLTYSRAPFLAYFAVAVAVAWRFRWYLGVATLSLGLALGTYFLPAYLEARAAAGGAPVVEGRLLVASDEYRLQAWRSTVAMWQDAPLRGRGFQSYRILHEEYGDPVLRAPHNEWLRFFGEGGLLAGLSALAFAGLTLLALARGRSWLTFAILGAFAGWVIAATFNNPLLYIQINGILFTIVGTGLAISAGGLAAIPMEHGRDGPEHDLEIQPE
jgi:O-antigen ligase